MATGTGLDAQVMLGAESVWGTPVTPTRALEFNEEGIEFTPTWMEPESIRVGTTFKRASRIKQSRKSVEGDLTFDILTKGMGLAVKHMLGSAVTTPTLINGTSYKQIHTPSGFVGLGLTVQVGRPEPTGTVQPFTYSGCKCMQWEFNLEDGSTPNLKLSFLGRNESTATALATASFLAGAASFDFSQATIKLGGTASTASGETSIAGGTLATTVIRSVSISGENPMADERFGIGNAGLRSEPLQNDIPTITGSLDAEFAKTELYDRFSGNVTFPLQVDMTGAVVSGANNYLFSFILPACKFKKASPTVGGPDLVEQSTDFEAYSDETNPVCQIKIVSDESVSI